MTDIAATVEAGATETNIEQVEQTATEQQAEPAVTDLESEARKTGWRPKGDWEGEADNWKDAKTWVEHSQNRDKVARIERSFNARLEKLGKQSERTIKALEAQHAREIADLTAERKVAIKSGNVDEVERLDKAIEVVKENAPEPEQPVETKATRDKIEQEWVADQDWWALDVDKTDFAIRMSQAILAKTPDITMAENLKQTEAAIEKKYPGTYGAAEAPQRKANGHAPVDGGGAFPGAPSKSDPLAKYSAAERAQAKADIARFPKIYPSAQVWIERYESKT